MATMKAVRMHSYGGRFLFTKMHRVLIPRWVKYSFACIPLGLMREQREKVG